jgi:hypothetical protein
MREMVVGMENFGILSTTVDRRIFECSYILTTLTIAHAMPMVILTEIENTSGSTG